MTTKELLSRGDLTRAIEQAQQDVKASPRDSQARMFLFELLCFAGQWARAARQLDALEQVSDDPKALGVSVCRDLLAAEEGRERSFADGVPPRFFIEAPSDLADVVDARDRLRRGMLSEARDLLERAEAGRPSPRGQMGEAPFEVFRDADDLLASVLEVFAHGAYYWVPWEDVQFLDVRPPRLLRDLLWVPARIALTQGMLGEVCLPCLYPGWAADADNLTRLGRRTDWVEVGDGLVRGVGLKTFLVDEEAFTILELRDIRFDPPAAVASSAPGQPDPTDLLPPMSTDAPTHAIPRVIDLEPLLRPIEGEDPAGRDLADDDEYHLIREARRAEIALTLRNDEFDKNRKLFQRRESKSADWHAVIRIGTEALARKSKDLQIAAWIAEALGHLHSLSGLRDGFWFLRELQERFWADAYPRLDPDDPESRHGPYDFLNSPRIVPLLIRGLPLTGGGGAEPYCYYHYLEARANDSLVEAKPGEERESAREALRGQGKVFSDEWERAVVQTPRGFYEARAAELRACLEAFNAWDQSTVGLFPVGPRGQSEAPSLSNIREGLEDCLHLVTSILEGKSATVVERDPGYAPPPPPPPPPPSRDVSPPEEGPPAEEEEPPSVVATDDDRGEDREGPEEPSDEPSEEPPESDDPDSSRPIAERADALARLLEAVESLRRDDPGDPVPYMLIRAYRMGESYALADRPSEARRPGPTSEVRRELRQLVADEQWDEVRERAEQALGGPEGGGWLDAHRYAIQALEHAGHANAARACRGLLRMYLGDFPDLPSGELEDGTAAADSKTRAWLAAVGPLATAPKLGEPDPAATAAGPTQAASVAEDGDVSARADALVAAGSGGEAIQLLQRAMATAAGGRERFMRQLHLAELCLRLDAPQVALPLLEDLDRQIDDLHLDRWEDPTLCARVVGALFLCIRTRGTTEGLQRAYARLCKFDASRALRHSPEARP